VEPELTNKHFDVVVEVLLKLKIRKSSEGKKIKVVETPITFDERMFGDSKRLLFAFFIAYTTSIIRLSALYLKSAFK
jgi:dolichol-phosphate mannosyltransferase